MSKLSRGGGLVCALVAALSLTACGSSGTDEPERKKPKMDMRQAGERAEVILDGTLDAIKPPVKWKYNTPVDIACSTGLNEPTGASTVKRSRYVTTKVSAERRGNLLGVVQRYWEGEGYRITSVNPSERMPSIHAKTPDGFVVRLGVGDVGNVFFRVASPCSTDSDMTFPQGTPGKPGGPQGKLDLIPRDESPFWSSREPLEK